MTMESTLLFSCLLIGTVISVPVRPDLPDTFHHLRYYYFPTPEKHVEIIFNDTQSLDASNIKPATKTFILLDGFTSNLTSYMSVNTKNTFAALSDHNFILVDWSFFNGNQFPVVEVIDMIFAYVGAMTQVPTAGETLAQFIDFLRVHKQIEFSDITILSHSLGCHAAGSTGKAVTRFYDAKIGRIVGLDPSFQITGLESEIRLQIGDASVVEIYHTSRMYVGESYPATGDITIYPNGGEVQPCEEQGAPGTTKCSNHSYSWKLYNYLLKNDTIKACPCKGAACFCKQCEFKCGDDGISIGPHIPENARGSYHVKTGYLDWD